MSKAVNPMPGVGWPNLALAAPLCRERESPATSHDRQFSGHVKKDVRSCAHNFNFLANNPNSPGKIL